MTTYGRGRAREARRARGGFDARQLLLGLLAFTAALLLLTPKHAQAIPRPLANCVERSDEPGVVQFHFGYGNQGSAVTFPVGPDNYFSPPPPNRGQPSDFATGFQMPSVVAPVLLAPPGIGSQISMRWILGGEEAVADLTLPGCDGMVWLGAWQPEQFYLSGDVVTFEGATWVATSFIEGGRPGEAEEWDPLVAPWEPDSVAGQRKPKFNRRGVARVKDPNVEAGSVVLIQYADPRRKGRLRPTNVVRVRAGRFVARGEPRTRFTYVVHAAP